MKLVMLDAHTLDPQGDLSWQPLTDLPVELVRHDRTKPEDVLERVRDAELVLTNKVKVTGPMLSQMSALRYIGVMATGYDVVDAKAARAQGVSVTNVPGYGSASVAQHTFALLLELTNHVHAHALSVARGDWARGSDWTYSLWPSVELAGKVMGVVGYGEIGRHVGRIASAYGMKLIYSTSRRQADPAWRTVPDLLRQSDVISLHCPLTTETRGMINAESLRLCKPSAYLLNTARGPLIVSEDLARALNEGHIAGAGLDVLPEEPPRSGNPLISAKNCLITPHIAWAAQEARQRLLCAIAQNISAFLAGKSLNVVNPA
jgi:glycerate dehydrogenase